ncbi:MAG: hypothetical protein H7A55_01310 [Verrucomicrobiaceae bacterium]|nr:hypothetical protein [Verrucomicrobiaceae bacterium]
MRRLLCKTLLLLITAAGAANANTTVAWNSTLYDSISLIDSNGVLLDGSFTFELGTFANAAPTVDNFSDWATNWKPLSTGNWSGTTRAFGNSFTFNTDGTVQGNPLSPTFTAGEQVFIWVRGPGGEMALVTDASPGGNADQVWLLPDITDDIGVAINWVLNSADTAVIGSVNQPSYRLQTAPAPEPTSVFLVLTALIILTFRVRLPEPISRSLPSPNLPIQRRFPKCPGTGLANRAPEPSHAAACTAYSSSSAASG